MKKKNLTLIESICIIAGSGIGGGVMAVPYLVNKTGIVPATIILLIAFIVTVILHIMIADLSIRSNNGSELLSVFKQHLFKGKYKSICTWLFYILMLITLCANLSAYVTGSGEILASLLNINIVLAKGLYFFVAALVVFFGLKIVAVNEKITVTIMMIVLLILAITSFTVDLRPIPLLKEEYSLYLAVYGMFMFSLSSLFSVPQVISGLPKNNNNIRKAIIYGLGINLLTIVIIGICTLISSETVTEIAIIGWSKSLGIIVNIFGSLFIVFAMLTTYWSISLALRDITYEQLNLNKKLCWLIATLPSFILTFILSTDFLDFMKIAGGAVAVIVALMVVPAYNNAIKNNKKQLLLGKFGTSKVLMVIIILFYLLMTIGSFIKVD